MYGIFWILCTYTAKTFDVILIINNYSSANKYRQRVRIIFPSVDIN